MSNADWDVSYCKECCECHLNGICPKSDFLRKRRQAKDSKKQHEAISSNM